MRLAAIGALAVALATSLSACAPYISTETATAVDPEQATERAAFGAIAGAAVGAGLGATFATIPPVGAIAGAEIGGGLGAAIGVMTTPPPPSYEPVAAPAQAVPGFYDGWPPGYHAPPDNPETQPPHAS